MPSAQEIVSTLLNSAAYDGGPTVSQVLKSLDTGLWIGGESTNGLPLATQIVDIHKTVTQPVIRNGEVTQIQDDADTNTMVRDVLTKLVEIQKAVAAKAPPVVPPKGK